MSQISDKQAIISAVENGTATKVYPNSISQSDNTVFMMTRCGIEKELVLIDDSVNNEFHGTPSAISINGVAKKAKRCPLNYANLQAIWKRLDYLKPRTLGVKKSFGAGDRLGIATPGHVQAVRNNTMAPIFTQQSIREMTRTGRTPQEVMNDACWGVFQTGYQEGFGADADHLKQPENIDTCFNAGFTFFTVDPGDHVNSAADTESAADLQAHYDELPWEKLEATGQQYQQWYAEKSVLLKTPTGDVKLTISGEDLLRAAVKYGKAVAHVKMMYQHLKALAGDTPVEFEVSVDETATPTTIAEHYFVAAELKRLGVQWVSLAPRFIGEFEKGVDYIGDLDQFRSAFAQHVGVLNEFGPYKISLHSGSDKFSIYPIASELAGEHVHLKTAGTSYLEALRAIAHVNPELFREILTYARERYPEDRATYHVSAQVEKVAQQETLSDAQLPDILDQFDTREACHVTFGSVLRDTNPDGSYKFREQFFQSLRENEQVYYDILEKHIGKHLSPFK